MKTLNKINLLFFLFVFVATNTIGQIRYGTIVFERKTNLEKRFSNNMGQGGKMTRTPGGGKASDSKYLIEKTTLYFTDSSSLFTTQELENVTDQSKTFQTTTYKNLISKNLETTINLLGENFSISDTIPQRIWKFTSRVRTILDHECKQAITKINDSTIIYAWFNTDVIPSVGPESYSGLPGAIMGLAYEDGSVTYFATEFKTDYPEILRTYKSTKSKKTYTRNQFITEFSTKYNPNYRLYKLIKDLLHFF